MKTRTAVFFLLAALLFLAALAGPAAAAPSFQNLDSYSRIGTITAGSPVIPINPQPAALPEIPDITVTRTISLSGMTITLLPVDFTQLTPPPPRSTYESLPRLSWDDVFRPDPPSPCGCGGCSS